MKKRYLLPLVVFVVLIGFFAAGLQLKPREVPSPLIGKPAPGFSLPVLDAPDKRFSGHELKGEVWLLNVWASWCAACLTEHHLLVELSKSGRIRMYGLNYKDKREDALAWLRRHGNPYAVSLSDTDGLVGIDFGVYGVPETFVIDRQGTIRLKHIGPITPEVLRDTILPMIDKLRSLDA